MSGDHPYDGTYRVETESTALGFMTGTSDGTTQIINSETNRVDAHGCKWNSRFERVTDEVVKMVSRADLSDADEDFRLEATDGSGENERTQHIYETLMDATFEDGQCVKLSGKVEANGLAVYIFMTRL